METRHEDDVALKILTIADIDIPARHYLDFQLQRLVTII